MKHLFAFSNNYMQYIYLLLFVCLYGIGAQFNGQAETLLAAIVAISVIRALQLMFNGEKSDWFIELSITMMVSVVLIGIGYIIAFIVASIFRLDLTMVNSVYAALALFFIVTGSLELKFRE